MFRRRSVEARAGDQADLRHDDAPRHLHRGKHQPADEAHGEPDQHLAGHGERDPAGIEPVQVGMRDDAVKQGGHAYCETDPQGRRQRLGAQRREQGDHARSAQEHHQPGEEQVNGHGEWRRRGGGAAGGPGFKVPWSPCGQKWSW